MTKKPTIKHAGFTLIEVMIAMSIFTVVMTLGIGSVLTALSQHQSAQDMRTVMDNLNFIMEDMARNIRLGTNFHCVGTEGEQLYSASGDTSSVIPQDCPSSIDSHYHIVFNDLNGKHLMYQIVASGTPVQIYKQEGDAITSLEDITPPEVQIDPSKSGFTVRGSLPVPTGSSLGDYGQPTVVIRLAGKIVTQNVTSNFALETEVTPRALDN